MLSSTKVEPLTVIAISPTKVQIKKPTATLNKAVRKIAPVIPDTNTAVSPLSVIGIIAGLGAAVLFRRRG